MKHIHIDTYYSTGLYAHVVDVVVERYIAYCTIESTHRGFPSSSSETITISYAPCTLIITCTFPLSLGEDKLPQAKHKELMFESAVIS